MNWAIEFAPEAVRELDKLDPQVSRRILKFLRDRVAHLKDPRSVGSALQGPKLGEFWKYRVGDYRIICRIEDHRFLILVFTNRTPAGNLPLDPSLGVNLASRIIKGCNPHLEQSR